MAPAEGSNASGQDAAAPPSDLAGETSLEDVVLGYLAAGRGNAGLRLDRRGDE
jgi:hypothetical protein